MINIVHLSSYYLSELNTPLKYGVIIYIYPNRKITPKLTIRYNKYADGHTITVYQSFIHDCIFTANCLIDSQSPTHRRPVAQPVSDQSQPLSNQLAINRPPVADWSPIFRDSSRRPVADWSTTEKMQFWLQLGCSCFCHKAVANRLQYMWPGL